jgi:Domain of unknown function (DUF4157)
MQFPAGRRNSLEPAHRVGTVRRAAGLQQAPRAGPGLASGALEPVGAMLNNSPRMLTQRKLADDIGNGPRMVELGALSDMINGNPRMAAQRGKFARLEAATAHPQKEGQASQGPARPTPPAPVQLRPASASLRNDTGLPDTLKSGLESLSGISMDQVRVHYNSPQPAQLDAFAFAQGADIHVAPRQERHLPHEAWHVVQQAQGRVRPTATMRAGVALNDDKSLEEEADRMGARALRSAPSRPAAAAQSSPGPPPPRPDAEDAAPRQLRAAPRIGGAGIVQRSIGFEYELGNVQTYAKDVNGAKVRLAKRHVLANPGQFEVTADDPPTGSPPGAMSDLELITPAIDDTVAGNRAVLETTLGAMVTYLGTLRAQPAETAVGTEFVGAHAATDYDDGVLQATAGLSPGGLANLASGRTEAEAGVERQAAQSEKAALARKWLVLDRDAKNRALDARIGHATKQEFHAYNAIGAADRTLFNHCLTQVGHLTAQEAELMAAVMSRILAIPFTARTRVLPYPKAAAGGLMARSDFATIIAALPPGIMASFASAAAFKGSLLAALCLATNDPNLQLGDPVFPGAVAGAVPLTLTLDAWFDGLYQAGAAREDTLTEANYPGGVAANPERQQLESLGSYGNRTDPPAAGVTRRPIFEFRNLGSVVVDDLVAQGLAVWDLVQRANRGTEA